MKLKITSRTVFLLIILETLAGSAWLSYPRFRNVFHSFSGDYYKYRPGDEIKSSVDLSVLPPAKAVPILMYHGVVKNPDSENTDQAHFISQMEMLKREGYQTITLEQFDNFLRGEFVLPPKPIIITFDDGRKDSYYPTDDVLKKLGFSAAIFVISGKPNSEDKFYLSWDELRKMRDSGRWEIEAHGTNAHDKILIDNEGSIGRFLTSRIFSFEKGLESVAEFEKRVERDYVQNIEDLKSNLGIESHYFAIPLNDYGQQSNSNYPEAVSFNNFLIKKYFRLAFIQINDTDDVYTFHQPFYNYGDGDPFLVKRVEMVNMEADFLKRKLEEESPKLPSLRLGVEDLAQLEKNAELAYGYMEMGQDGLHLKSTSDSPSSKVLFGDEHWGDYAVEARIKRVKGRSVVLIACASDNKNYLSFGITDNGFFLRETAGGEERPLEPSVIPSGRQGDEYTFKMVIHKGVVSGYVDEELIFKSAETSLERGQVGFKVWDDRGNGEGILEALVVAPAE